MNRAFAPLLMLSLLAACSYQAAEQDPVARGERDFRGLGCVKCHRVGYEGVKWGPDLTMLGFRKSPEWIDQWLQDPHAWNPKTVMPNFNLPAGMRKDLVAYLSTQRGEAWTEKPWKTRAAEALPVAERGKLIFDSVGCVTCHAQDGYGGYPNNNVAGGLIPSLTKVTEGYTKEELRDKIKFGVTPIPDDSEKPAPLLLMPKWSEQLSDREIDDVVEYLFTLGPATAANGASSDSF